MPGWSGEREAVLIDASTEALFTTPHYDGYGAVLVRLADVDLQVLGELLEDSDRSRARKRLVCQIDERPAE